MPSWIPFGMTEEQSSVLVDGIPSYMRGSLLDWLNFAELLLCRDSESPGVVDKQRRRQLINRFDRTTRQDSGLIKASIRSIDLDNPHQENTCLQYVDFLIHELCELKKEWGFFRPTDSEVDSCLSALERILSESGSKWKVGTRNGYAGLEERVDSMLQDMADEVMRDPGESSSQLLSKSWHALFGKNPNYSMAYTTAIQAVEAVACPMVSPKDVNATLSKSACVMRDQGWNFVLKPKPKSEKEMQVGGSNERIHGGIASVLMDAMMYSQPNRHGGANEVKEPTKEQAEAAVYSAVYLVQCFKSGLVLPPER